VPGFEPVHLLLVPKLSLPSLRYITDLQREEIAAEVELLAPEARNALQLERRGYSIVWDARTRDAEGVVHLTAGECRGSCRSLDRV
jgi:diadenosine tetraphosphate (Ap4A) HIT family hydrolase